MTDTAPLWTPSDDRIRAAPLSAFIAAAARVSGRPIADYDTLHAWSVEDREGFWPLVWDWCGIVGERGERVLVDGDRMPGARFFPDARLNFAENLLKKSGPGDALVFAARTRWRGASPGTSCAPSSRACSSSSAPTASRPATASRR